MTRYLVSEGVVIQGGQSMVYAGSAVAACNIAGRRGFHITMLQGFVHQSYYFIFYLDRRETTSRKTSTYSSPSK